MLNTNGLELVRDRTLAAELARRKPHLELSLQLDGLDHDSHQVLRGADLLAEKEAVLQVIREYDLPTTLVCTVVRDVNEMQLGPLLRRGIETPQIRGITYQPATWSGRYDAAQDPLDRLTLADVIRLVARTVRRTAGGGRFPAAAVRGSRTAAASPSLRGDDPAHSYRSHAWCAMKTMSINWPTA